jgi:capsular polysaccharide transport system permease protein
MTTVTKRGPWKIWFDVIFALFAREIKISSNDKLGVSWSVLSPVMFILVLSFLRGRLNGGETHTIPTFLFMAYGLILVDAFILTLNSGSGAIQKNKALFAFRQVQPISAVVAAGLFQLLVKVFVVIGIAIATYFLKMNLHVADPLGIIFNIILLWISALCLGLLLGILTLYVPEIKKLQLLVTRPLFFISGVFFSLKDVPKEYWWLLDWNPILHAIELSRYAAYPTYGNEGVSFNYLALFTLVVVFLTLAFYHNVWKQAISR